jgi:hypothetical protein
MQVLSPFVGPIQEDPDLYCALGDRINFNFPVVLPTHPFSLYTNGGAVFPGATDQAYIGAGTFVFLYVKRES